jgi:DNA-binding PadR family transcriptional regulator
MSKISNKETALLGLLSEHPKHAYEIESDIKERDMRYWTEISMSSVYKLLNKLEKDKLLESELRISKNNLSQKVYSITAAGDSALKEKLQELLSAWQVTVYPVDIGLANINLLDKKTALRELKKYSDSLDNMLKCYGELKAFLLEHKCPVGNVHLAVRRLYLVEAEKNWINNFIEDYKKFGR